jgi:hypothetical protein
MSQIQFGSAFVANAMTVVTFGRATTDAENVASTAEKTTLLNGGAKFTQVTTNSDLENPENPATSTVTSYWGTLADAQAYIAFVNTFSPPPAVATVETI